jgi:uncharacterized damage-inducible protein DinB
MKRLFVRGLLGLVVLAAVLVGVGSWMAGDSPRSREQLLSQLAEMEALLNADDAAVEDVSGWSVHQHVEHLLRANDGILGMIEAGQPPETIEPKALVGRVVLMTGHIPRGRGQAPESTVPEGLSRDELLALRAGVEQAARALDLEQLPDGVVGNHAVFGGFTPQDWLRFMAVHDAHHLQIVTDILEQGSAAE